MRYERQPIYDNGFARPAPARFPYEDHRTMADIMDADRIDREADERFADWQRRQAAA